ncbi:MAG: helix-turn-helix transcriptional regulator [Chloroflexi bacterium]|nr:helix-turn-helix transcriptional regulator [Chloroflexota bacterium]
MTAAAAMIRDSRVGRALSQAAAAEIVGVTVRSWSAWETGAARPTLAHVRAIADAFHIDAAALASAVHPPSERTPE